MSSKRPRPGGFTLVELLVVIVIIGILMGLLIAVVGPTLFRTYSFAITAEINELEGAIDQFKTKFGFYPPSELDLDGDGTNDLTPATGDPEDLATFKQYLRRIAPNHEQTDADIGAWWTAVGQHLDNDSILVFWLSGLKRSAQFPLTNGNGGAVYDGFAVGEDPDNYVFFEFQAGQLVDGNDPKVKRYLQRKVLVQPYIYYDSQHYATATITIAGDVQYPYREYPVIASSTYYNPSTFQIVAAGKDEIFGAFAGPDNDWGSAPEFRDQRDNIANFAGGVLERLTQ
jgi:general secretion pathway protein G